MKKTLFLVLTFILCTAMLFGCTANGGLTTEAFDKQPDKILENSIDYSVIGLSNTSISNLNKSLTKTPESGKLIIGVDAAALTGDTTMPTFNLSTAGDSKNGRFDLDFALSSEALNADARLYIDGDMLVLSSDSILGGAYAVKFEEFSTFIEKLENSELLKSLGMPADTLNALCEQYGINDEYISGLQTAWKNTSEAVSSFGDMTFAMQEKVKPVYTPAVEETVEINGATVPVITSTTALTSDTYSEIMEIYTDWIMNNAGAYFELINAAVPKALSEQSGVNIAESYDLVMQEIQTAIQQSMGDMTADANIKYYISKDTSKLVKMDMQYQAAIQGQQMAYDLAVIMTDGFEFNGTITADGETIPLSGKITYVEQNGIKTWNYNIATESSGEKVDTSMSLVLDDAKGTYKLSIAVPDGYEADENVIINGTYDVTDKSFAFTVDSILADGETAEVGITVGYESGITVESPTEYKELLALTADEAYALIGRIGTFAMNIQPQPQPDYVYEDEYYYDDVYYGDDEYYFTGDEL